MKDVLGEAVMLDAWLQRRLPLGLTSPAQCCSVAGRRAAGHQPTFAGSSHALPASPQVSRFYQRAIEALATKSHTRVLVFGCAKKKIYVRATSTHSCAIPMSISCIG